ncbi:MAG: hypothetical protein ACJA0N_000014 [Pseudohongiellaceae bacterium]|jgi:hypothetical protein
METLESVVYVSSATKLLSPQEIAHLLTHARDYNKAHQITGMLIYIGGNFMQYLEGPSDKLDIIYKIILDDHRHKGVIELIRKTITAREFSGWSMAYNTKDADGHTGSIEEKQLITSILSPIEARPGAAQILLHNFWAKNRP